MKIYIYSASGAGSTTIGKIIGKSLNLKYVDIDDILFYETDIPYTKRRPSNERVQMLKERIKEENIIVSGWFSDGIDNFIDSFDFVFFITAKLEVRLERIKCREMSRWGNRVLAGGDMHENYLKFIKWAIDYETLGLDTRSYALHLDFFNRIKNKKKQIENIEIEETVNQVLDFINS